MSGRLFIIGTLCLLCGLILGRMAPQADLHRMRAKLDEAKAAPGKRTSSETAVLGVRNMLNVSEQDIDRARRIKQARERLTNQAGRVEADMVEAESATIAVTNARTRRLNDASSLTNNIANLKKGWELRSQLARNNLVKNAELTTAEATRFDVVVEVMNLRLGAAVDAWSAKLLEQGAINEEAGVRMMNEFSQVLVLTYDEMDRNLPAGWREKVGPKFDLVRFVDPEVLTPLQDIENLPNHTSDRGGGRE